MFLLQQQFVKYKDSLVLAFIMYLNNKFQLMDNNDVLIIGNLNIQNLVLVQQVNLVTYM